MNCFQIRFKHLFQSFVKEEDNSYFLMLLPIMLSRILFFLQHFILNRYPRYLYLLLFQSSYKLCSHRNTFKKAQISNILQCYCTTNQVCCIVSLSKDLASSTLSDPFIPTFIKILTITICYNIFFCIKKHFTFSSLLCKFNWGLRTQGLFNIKCYKKNKILLSMMGNNIKKYELSSSFTND